MKCFIYFALFISIFIKTLTAATIVIDNIAELDDLAVFNFAMCSDGQGHSTLDHLGNNSKWQPGGTYYNQGLKGHRLDTWVKANADFCIGVGDHYIGTRGSKDTYWKTDPWWNARMYPVPGDHCNEVPINGVTAHQREWGRGAEILTYVDIINRTGVEWRPNGPDVYNYDGKYYSDDRPLDYYAVIDSNIFPEIPSPFKVHLLGLHWGDSSAFAPQTADFMIDKVNEIAAFKTAYDILIISIHMPNPIQRARNDGIITEQEKDLVMNTADLVCYASTHKWGRDDEHDGEYNGNEAFHMNTGIVIGNGVANYCEFHVFDNPPRFTIQAMDTKQSSRKLHTGKIHEWDPYFGDNVRAWIKEIDGPRYLADWNNFAIGTPSNSSEVISQSVPTQMNKGQSYSVSVTMKNVGEDTWRTADGHKLGSQNPVNNQAWGISRVALPHDVAPNQTVTFNFSVAAPNEDNNFNFQWQMIDEAGLNTGWFGPKTANATVTVGNGPQHVVTLFADHNYGGWAALFTVGEFTRADLLAAGGVDNDVDSVQVTPGYRLELYDGDDFTGDVEIHTADNPDTPWHNKATSLKVISLALPSNDAQFVSQTVPTSMDKGETYSISVTMKNIGDDTWSSAAGHKLGSQNPNGNTTWGLNRIPLPHDVVTGQNVTFTFNVTAPTSDSVFNMQWQMVDDLTPNQGWFGDNTNNLGVVVGTIQNVVSLYGDHDYLGWEASFPVGEFTLADLIAAGGVENDVDSVRVTAGYRLELYSSDNFAGDIEVHTADNPDTPWHNRVSSLKVISVGVEFPPVPTPTGANTLVDARSTWKYLDDGSDQGTTWNANAFDDSTWQSGGAILGYGNPVLTTVSYGSDSANKYITTYFRQEFEVTDASLFENLTAQIMRDDGFVMHINGVEVARDNMPTGAILYNTEANGLAGGDDETTYHVFNLDHTVLQEGTNLIAVEIHQDNAGSSDISFDMLLSGDKSNAPPLPLNGAQFVSMIAPDTVDAGSSFDIQVTYNNTGNTTWTSAEQYRLNAINPTDNSTWGSGTNWTYVDPADSVLPGDNYTFIVSCVAPITAGDYNFQRQMKQEGVGWFGNLSTNKIITVNAVAINYPPNITSTPVLTAVVGELYQYSLTAIDPEGDLLFFSGNGPSWDTNILPQTISGTPTESDIGTYNITLSVSDSTNTVDQNFIITVVAATDPGSDDDNDGIPYLVEYALGTDPDDASSGKLPDVAQNSTNIEMKFRRAQADVTYIIQKSTDLINWTDYMTVNNTHGSVGNDATVPVPLAEMSSGKMFLRLKVEQ